MGGLRQDQGQAITPGEAESLSPWGLLPTLVTALQRTSSAAPCFIPLISLLSHFALPPSLLVVIPTQTQFIKALCSKHGGSV